MRKYKNKYRNKMAMLLAAGMVMTNTLPVIMQVTNGIEMGRTVEASYTMPEGYVEATDSDFTDDGYGRYRYTGSETHIIIPRQINGKNVTSTIFMFRGSGVEGVATYPDNSITNMSDMFSGSKAQSLDLSSFDTSSVTNMSSMFSRSQAQVLDLSSFDTSRVTNMRYMFDGSQAQVLDLSSFDTSRVTNMRYMFDGSQAQVLDLSSFDTLSVTDMSGMFRGSQAQVLDLSTFDTLSVTDMTGMFSSSQAQELDLTSFNTFNVSSMHSMFGDSQAVDLDIASFNTTNLTDMSNMFENSKASVLDLSSFNTSKVSLSNLEDAFKGASAVTGYARTEEDMNKLNSSSGRPSRLVFTTETPPPKDKIKPEILLATKSVVQHGKIIKVSVIAQDDVALHAQPYSFDNGVTWQTSADKLFTENKAIVVKVRDAAGNISDPYPVLINEIIEVLPPAIPTMPTLPNVPTGESAKDSTGNVVVDTDGSIKNPDNTTKVDKDGNILDKDGGILVDKDGNILDKDGNTVVDKDGTIVNGSLDKDGNIIDNEGNIIVDKDGNILDRDGSVAVDKDGNILDKDGNVVVDKDGNIKDSQGNIVVDKDGNILDKDGNIIVDKDGNHYVPGLERPNKLPVKDSEGNVVIDGAGNILDKEGNIVVDTNNKVVGGSIDENGNVIDSEGNIVVDKDGNVLDKNGNVVADKEGKPVIPGINRPTTLPVKDKDGNIVIDSNGNILDKDGNVIVSAEDKLVSGSIDSEGNIKDNQGNIVIDKDGNILDGKGNIVTDKDGSTYIPGLPRPSVLPVQSVDGSTPVIDSQGNILDKNGNVIVDSNNKVVGGTIDSNGNVVDSEGNVVVDKDGNIFDSEGNKVVDKDGNLVDNSIKVTSVNITDETLSLEVGSTQAVLYEIAPVDAANKDVTWTSTDSSVADVMNGNVIGMKVGSAILKVTTVDGKFTDSILVTVKPAFVKEVKSIALADENIIVKEYTQGQTYSPKGSILVTYNDDTTETVRITPAMVSYFDSSTVGETFIELTYKGVTTTYDINIIAKPISSVTITAEYDDVTMSNRVKVDLTTTGEVDYLELPNGAKVYKSELSYILRENGTYVFNAIGKDGTSKDSAIVDIDNIDNEDPIIVFSYDPRDLTRVEVSVIDNNFDRLVTPNGTVVNDSTYEFDATQLVGTFTAYDQAGRRSVKDFNASSLIVDGTSSHTFVAIDGIPTEWTNKDAVVRVGAHNAIDGIDGVEISKVQQTSDRISAPTTTEPAIQMFSLMGFGPAAGPMNHSDPQLSDITMDGNGEIAYKITVLGMEYEDTASIDKIDKVMPTLDIEVVGDEVVYTAGDDLSGIRTITLPNGDVIDLATDKTLSHNGRFTMEANGEFEIIVEDYAGNITTMLFNLQFDPEPEVPGPTDPETPEPTDPEVPGPTDPETPEPTDPEVPGPTDPTIPGQSDPTPGVPGSNTTGSGNTSTTSSVVKAEDSLRFTLPVGEIDLSVVMGLNPKDMSQSVFNIKRGLQTVSFIHKGKEVSSKVEGIGVVKGDIGYKDVNSKHWAYNTINSVTQDGILVGTDVGVFSPSATLTYADTFVGINRVLMLNNEFNLINDRAAVGKYMIDFDKNHWAYYGYASILSKVEQVQLERHTRGGNLMYREVMTRGALSALIFELTMDLDIEQKDHEVLYNDLTIVPDDIEFNNRTGIMIGDNYNNFNPNAVLTRVEFAAVLERLNAVLSK